MRLTCLIRVITLFQYIYICSAWEGGETQKGGRDKESIKDPPPATLGRVDYIMDYNGKHVW